MRFFRLLCRAFPLQTDGSLYTILLVGVNGVGKTTTAARLAYGYQQKGASVILGAADTFRAAAIDQLQTWGQRLGVEVVAKNMGSDPGSVAYETLAVAQRQRAQVAIIDTAGRLHNKKHLMEELAKIRRVMGKAIPNAPHETPSGTRCRYRTKCFRADRGFFVCYSDHRICTY